MGNPRKNIMRKKRINAKMLRRANESVKGTGIKFNSVSQVTQFFIKKKKKELAQVL